MLSPLSLVRNARLLADAAQQHLKDDPALLALQISRRLPMSVRRSAGRLLRYTGERSPRKHGLAALGAFMAGEESRAVSVLEKHRSENTGLGGEVAVLADRVDLLPRDASAQTRARALWARGDLTGAVDVLETAGLGSSTQARRLRSEIEMLDEGFRLAVPRSALSATEVRSGEQLRVLHLLTNSLPHTQSGYAVRTHNILTALRTHGIRSEALTRTGYPVMVGKPFCAEVDEIDGIPYRRTLPATLGVTPRDRLDQEVDEALRIVERFRPHVLHATTDFRNALVAQAVSAATGIPWIFEVRGLMEQTWIASHRSDESRALAASSEKVERVQRTETDLARHAAAVVTLSRTMASVLEARGVPSEGITLVPNGVDAALLEEQLTPAQARELVDAEVPADALVVGAVSALVDYEGFDVLLRAVGEIISDPQVPSTIRDRVHVVLAGDGVSAPALQDLSHRLGIEDRLHMPGRVPRQVARLWVQTLDVVVVPRKDLEVSRTVTPQKPAEALALGRPVVASDLPALRETLEDDGGDLVGVLFPAGDVSALSEELVDLLSDPERRRALSVRGRAQASEKTWPALMRRYERTYRSVVRTAPEENSSGN